MPSVVLCCVVLCCVACVTGAQGAKKGGKKEKSGPKRPLSACVFVFGVMCATAGAAVRPQERLTTRAHVVVCMNRYMYFAKAERAKVKEDNPGTLSWLCMRVRASMPLTLCVVVQTWLSAKVGPMQPLQKLCECLE